MLFKVISIVVLTLIAGEMPPAPATAPAPLGTTTADVGDISYPIKMLASCLAGMEARATVTVEVLTDTDSDDQQSYRFVIESHAHEDAVDCIHAQVAEWGGVP